MLSSLSNLFGDGRGLPVLAGVIALLLIAALAFWVYRLAFANRLRPPGGARGRAPRLGVVDVFGLDGQRQLVIVRRDNVEHLLLLGGPNDIVVEPNILRSIANGRDAGKAGAPIDASMEPPAPAPAAPPPSRASAPIRRDPLPRTAPAESPAPDGSGSQGAPPPARPARASHGPEDRGGARRRGVAARGASEAARPARRRSRPGRFCRRRGHCRPCAGCWAPPRRRWGRRATADARRCRAAR